MNPNTAIRDLMSTEVVTIRGEDTLTKVSQIFSKKTFHHLPVVDDKRQLVGIISKEDILRLLSVRTDMSDREFDDMQVKDIMTSNVVTLDPDDSIGLAADIFLANRFHALPIVEGTNLMGILTTYDLIKFCFKEAWIDDENMEVDYEPENFS